MAGGAAGTAFNSFSAAINNPGSHLAAAVGDALQSSVIQILQLGLQASGKAGYGLLCMGFIAGTTGYMLGCDWNLLSVGHAATCADKNCADILNLTQRGFCPPPHRDGP